jgi:hypothetical protein
MKTPNSGSLPQNRFMAPIEAKIKKDNQFISVVIDNLGVIYLSGLIGNSL